jgi:hypothetical protein
MNEAELTEKVWEIKEEDFRERIIADRVIVDLR